MAKNWLGDELDRNGWPVKVPILGPRDFCTKSFNKGDKCCLAGWGRAATSDRPTGCGAKTTRVLNAIEEVIARDWDSIGIVSYNDRIATPADRARVWNRAMRDLGYNVPASACK